MVRTGFLLEYIWDPQLRAGITVSTNKVESYHSFTDWITFGGEALVSVFDSEEQEKWIKYTDLIANAIMLQNAVDITLILKELRAEGFDFGRKEVARLSPYLRKHLRRFGDYVLSLEEVPVSLTEDLLSLELDEKQSIAVFSGGAEVHSAISEEEPAELVGGVNEEEEEVTG